MSSGRTQRGRSASAAILTEKKKNNTRNLYIGIGVLVLLAFIGLGVAALTTAPVPLGRVPDARAALPGGVTAEGFQFVGAENAPVTVVEYADYQCPACRAFATQIKAQFEQTYVVPGNVKFVFHEFPLAMHRNARPAAEASRCAADQGAFWRMHDMLFYNQAQWRNLDSPVAQFGGYASQLGLDKTAFDGCMSAGTHRAVVGTAYDAGETIKIPGTPTFIVNGQQVDADGLQSAVDAAIAAAPAR